jgi:hypothetical protein
MYDTYRSVTVKVCANVYGEADAALVQWSSGDLDFDDYVISVVRGWRFRPYQVEGVPSAVCASYRFRMGDVAPTILPATPSSNPISSGLPASRASH